MKGKKDPGACEFECEGIYEVGKRWAELQLLREFGMGLRRGSSGSLVVS